MKLFHHADVDESDAEGQVSAYPTRLRFLRYANRSAVEIFLHFYNATAANVVVGTTTPVDIWSLAAGERGHIDFGSDGIAYSTALTIAATTGIGGTGAPAANDLLVSIGYED